MIHAKPTLSIVFIGHVDAGKSTLCGQILAQLNLVDPRTLAKHKEESKNNNRESWYLSYITDTNPEERAKGKTVETGRTSFCLNTKKIVILDAPGHKSYISQMILGAAQADLAILVLSARINEFEAGLKAQTKEHILLAKSMGIKELVCLVNKMDDSSVHFCEARFLQIKERMKKVLRGLYGDVAFIPVSGYLGFNVKDKDSEKMPWYEGCSFLEFLDSYETKNQNEGVDRLRAGNNTQRDIQQGNQKNSKFNEAAEKQIEAKEKTEENYQDYKNKKTEENKQDYKNSKVEIKKGVTETVHGIQNLGATENEQVTENQQEFNARVGSKQAYLDEIALQLEAEKSNTDSTNIPASIQKKNLSIDDSSSSLSLEALSLMPSFEFTVIDKQKTLGTILFFGKLNKGTITPKTPLKIIPSNQTTTILTIFDEEDNEITFANQGDSIKIRLKDHSEETSPFSIFVDPKNEEYTASKVFTSVVTIIEVRSIISAGYKAILHFRNLTLNCEIKEIRNKINEKWVKKKFAKKGETCFVKIEVENEVVLYKGDDVQKKECFAIREKDCTVALGKVRNIIDQK